MQMENTVKQLKVSADMHTEIVAKQSKVRADSMQTENAAKQSKASADSMQTECTAKQSKGSADSMQTENTANQLKGSADSMQMENTAKQLKGSADSMQTENAAKQSKGSVDSMQMENAAKQLKSADSMQSENTATQSKASADNMQMENVVKQLKASADSRRKQIEISRKIFQRLLESGHPAAQHNDFADVLEAYFIRLPPRYAQDVNIDRAEDVLVHKQLLELAEVPGNRPAFTVRAVHVLPVGLEDLERSSDSSVNASPKQEQSLIIASSASRQSIHPPPSFGSSPNLEALAFELTNSVPIDEDKNSNSDNASQRPHKPMHEVTFSTQDRPKLLSQLSSVLADIGLNIREAHVFCTVDDYSLDVFVVDGWPTEDTEELHQALQGALSNLENEFLGGNSPLSSPPPTTNMDAPDAEIWKIQSEGCDDWELDFSQLKFLNKVASGSFGELSRGTYCGQEVAIKVLKPERLNENLHREFVQEVSILRKVRHKNVVQFIGACTRPPNLCIVTEFMVGGSIYDYLHKQRGTFKLPSLIRASIDVSKGMDFLHQSNIIHRDLKAANLLMDENEVVKVADFGVARVRAHSGKMTAETGTYRWMAPEVINHQSYDHKADVFSFGIVVWELLTGKLPYDYLTPLQAAIGVVQKGLRPAIPKGTQPRLAELLQSCWQQDPAKRPEFKGITVILREIMKEVLEEEKKDKKSAGFFAGLKRMNR